MGPCKLRNLTGGLLQVGTFIQLEQYLHKDVASSNIYQLKKPTLSRFAVGVFTNAQDWQYYHYYQLCIPYVCSFLHYLHHVKLVNLKLEISGY